VIFVAVPSLELEFERRHRMPCSLYESVRAGVLEMDAYFRKRPKAAVIMGMSTDRSCAAGGR
jgi:hypothetical protein